MIKYELLYNSLCQLGPIPKEQWSILISMLAQRDLKKGEFFLRAGEYSEEIGFVISGLIRMYYSDTKGNEYNHSFMFENELATGYPSIVLKEPSLYSIQALEDTSLLVVKYSEFEKLYDMHPCWDRVGRKAAELNYVDKVMREYELLLRDASQRYMDLLKSRPGFEKRVPQYHIASYLGVTPSSLNRIIKKIERGEIEEE